MRPPFLLCISLALLAFANSGCGAEATEVPGGSGGSDARAAESCSSANCDGCCDGNRCVEFVNMENCGQSGSSCRTCRGNEICSAGECIQQADCSQCENSGCCLDGQCQDGTTQAACGKGGDACEVCGDDDVCGETNSCESTACDSTTCSDGCCTANGECLEVGSIEQSKDNCGDEANACTECSDSDISCTNGACVPAGSACLDSCDDGCCMGDTCVKLEMQANATCGQASVCETCMGNDNCAQGSCQDGPAWSVTIVSAIIASTDFEGDDWDLFGEGDPKVKGGLGGEPADDFAVPYEDGTLSPAWNYTVGAYTQADLVTKGLFLVFEDDDISFDDPMGDCTFTITQGGLDLGTVTQAVCGPKVTNLKIDFVLIQ